MRGEVVYLYAFDVANEATTSGLTELLGHRVVPFQLPPDRTLPRDVPLHQPLHVDLPSCKGAGGIEVKVQARIYTVGVINIAFAVTFDVPSWDALVPYHQPKHAPGLEFDRQARTLCEQICAALRDRLRHAAPVSEPEAYTVFCVTAIDQARDMTKLSPDERREIAGLLTETPPARLAEAQVAEVWRLERSFETTDLVVIDWDAALVVNLAGPVNEELFVLELANLQLEEFRIMDERLDQYLDRAYEDLEKRSWWFFATSGKVLHALRRFRVDATKLADEVSHITKFFGDWHLARVYLAANHRFYLEAWKQSVEQRLRQLDELYRLAHSDVYDQRMMWMEAAIVLLFVIDILALFFWQR